MLLGKSSRTIDQKRLKLWHEYECLITDKIWLNLKIKVCCLCDLYYNVEQILDFV